jgi:hypothetical protein
MGERMTIKHISARQHPRLFYSDIFTPVNAGRRKRGVEWIKEFDDVTVTIRMFDQLDVADQDLMLCILAMARSCVNTKERTEYLTRPSETPEALKSELSELKGYKPSERAELSIDKLPTLHIQTTCHELLSEIGRSTGGSDYKWLLGSLKRLSSTSFMLEDDKRLWGGSNILSFGLDKETKGVLIHLNALSAHSIWAPSGDYIYSDRRERHSLGLDLARSLHDKLCARVRAGEKNCRLKVDNLLQIIYNDRDAKGRYIVPTKFTVSKRRKRLEDAIEQINKLPAWSITIDGKGANMTIVASRKKAK